MTVNIGTTILDTKANSANIRIETRQNIATGAVINIDYGSFKSVHCKQLSFGGSIGLEIAVIIEVVATQIGKYRDIDLQTSYATLIEAMRRDL